jgi:hypothetical protein
VAWVACWAEEAETGESDDGTMSDMMEIDSSFGP